MIAAANPRLWKQLCEAVGVPHLVEDPRFLTNMDRVNNRTALKAELEAAFATFTTDALVARLNEAGVACGRVRTVPEALQDVQVEPRQMLIPLQEPEFEGFNVLGNPIKLTNHSVRIYRRPPRLGEHTEEVLQEVAARPSARPQT